MQPSPSATEHKPWEILHTREVYSAPPWITVSVQTVRLPDGRVVEDYHQVQMPDFAVIYAETSNGSVLVERQYKHGIGAVTLALPAGLIQTGEDPLKAAQRELREETGFEAIHWQSMGSFVPNSNYGCGRAHLFRCSNARCVTEPNAGDLEEIETVRMTSAELLQAVRSGNICSVSMVAAIAMATHPVLGRGVHPPSPGSL